MRSLQVCLNCRLLCLPAVGEVAAALAWLVAACWCLAVSAGALLKLPALFPPRPPPGHQAQLANLSDEQRREAAADMVMQLMTAMGLEEEDDEEEEAAAAAPAP